MDVDATTVSVKGVRITRGDLVGRQEELLNFAERFGNAACQKPRLQSNLARRTHALPSHRVTLRRIMGEGACAPAPPLRPLNDRSEPATGGPTAGRGPVSTDAVPSSQV